MEDRCTCCGEIAETKHLPLYVIGSEGTELCHQCEMLIVRLIRNIRRKSLKKRENKMSINEKVYSFIQLREELLNDAKAHNTDEQCPLNLYKEDLISFNSHRDLSQILSGIGRWRWKCPFCGQEFEE